MWATVCALRGCEGLLLQYRAGRGDLLAEEAGLMAGTWSVWIGTGDYAIAVGLLVLAGAEHDRIAGWVDVGRERAMTPRHSI